MVPPPGLRDNGGFEAIRRGGERVMAAGERALIVGAGSGLSAAIARRCAAEGMAVVLAARDIGKLAGLAGEIGAACVACDAGDAAAVDRLYREVDAGGDRLDLVVYNASGRARGPIVELDPAAVEQAIRVTGFGGFLVARGAAQRMVRQGHGTILFTGAPTSAAPTACSIPRRSPRPICSCTASTAAPGPGRSNCDPGSKISEPDSCSGGSDKV